MNIGKLVQVIGPVVDVYAFGLIMFEVASGQVPHAATSLQAIIELRTSAGTPPIAWAMT